MNQVHQLVEIARRMTHEGALESIEKQLMRLQGFAWAHAQELATAGYTDDSRIEGFSRWDDGYTDIGRECHQPPTTEEYITAFLEARSFEVDTEAKTFVL